ncbi:unnamed protein product [Effrenium voratum]|uniref:Uncharacterized protein n=1 Tax=Effrenium voratum TaxID=2562239 RepID=A0AA36IE97_9DINO|nr:unnamed protein product [Effrenium voratum]
MDGSVSRPSSGRSPNKYASFSPSRKVEDNTKVDTVQIKFLDPSSQKLSSKEVFVDPDTWSRKASEMRFLISADLVNLVAESFAARSARFAKAKKRLEQSRLCFLVDLWKLRGLVDRVSRCVAEGCQACPIQFFVPELYFDEHTLEQLRQASDVFFEHLLVEMSQLQERLDLLGGKNWRNLLQYSLKFMSTTEVGSMLMDAIPDPKTRKTVENAITRGLWDQMAELQPVLEELEEAMEDYNARYDWVQEDIAQKLAQIAKCGERQQVAEEKFEEAVPEVPEDSSSEIEPENEAEDEEESVQDDNSSAASSADDWDEEEEVRKFILLKGVPPSKAQLKKMRRTQAREQKMTKMKEQKASKEEGIQQKSRARIRSLLARWEKSVASVKEEVKVLEQPLQDAQQQSADTMDEDPIRESRGRVARRTPRQKHSRWFRSEDALWQHEQAKHVDEEDEQEPKKCENEQEPSSGEYTYETCYTYESEVESEAKPEEGRTEAEERVWCQLDEQARVQMGQLTNDEKKTVYQKCQQQKQLRNVSACLGGRMKRGNEYHNGVKGERMRGRGGLSWLARAPFVEGVVVRSVFRVSGARRAGTKADGQRPLRAGRKADPSRGSVAWNGSLEADAACGSAAWNGKLEADASHGSAAWNGKLEADAACRSAAWSGNLEVDLGMEALAVRVHAIVEALAVRAHASVEVDPGMEAQAVRVHASVEVDLGMEAQAVRGHAIVEGRVQEQLDTILAVKTEKAGYVSGAHGGSRMEAQGRVRQHPDTILAAKMAKERGLAGPLKIAPGTVEQLNEFVDELPEVPRDKVWWGTSLQL